MWNKFIGCVFRFDDSTVKQFTTEDRVIGSVFIGLSVVWLLFFVGVVTLAIKALLV